MTYERKVTERRQIAKIISESDYNGEDKKRFKTGNEMQWMDFETRMRQLMGTMIQSVIDVTVEDQSTMLTLETENADLTRRIETLEGDLLRKKHGKTTDRFDDYD